MKAVATIIDDGKFGPTLVVTYYIRRRQLNGSGLEHVLAFINRDVVRRVLSWKKTWS